MSGPTGNARARALWSCSGCGRTFANRNQTHTCTALTDLDQHFVGKGPVVRAIFDRVLDVVSQFGPVTVLPEKTRIAMHVRMSFARLTRLARLVDLGLGVVI